MTLFALSPVVATAIGGGVVPGGEYAGQPFTFLLSGEYASFGANTLTTGAGTYVEIGGELFEGIVSPGDNSLCCGEGGVSTDEFWMYGQVSHDGHNHLFAASARTDGSYCVNVENQTGTITEPPPGVPPHDPDIGLMCFEGALVDISDGGAREVAIDVMPGSAANPVNPRRRGVIPVAILSSEDFDATTVDPLTVRFGPGEAVEIHGRGHVGDVNADGRMDLVLHFAVEATGIVAGTTSVLLTGETFDGTAIEGTDTIVTVPR